MFAFKEELEPTFILSEKLEEIEKGFYEFSYTEEGKGYIYDGEEFGIEDIEFLEGYADYKNNTLVSVNHIAKLLFHKDISKTNGIIKPLKDKELTEITKKLLNHQIHLYGRLDKESYVFFHNAIKTELLDIITADSEKKALEIILNSIFFNEQEKKAAKNVIEQKDKYFTSFLTNTIVEEAVKQKVKIDEIVKIRNGIFEKRYKLHPAAVVQYLTLKVENLSELEKLALTDPENVPMEILDKSEALRNEILLIKEILDPQNKLFSNRNYLKFFMAQKVLNKVLGIEKINEIKVNIKQWEDKSWDTYNILRYIKAFVDYIDMNLLTYAIKKQKLDPVVLKFAKDRIIKVKEKISKLNKKQLKSLQKQYKYKDITIKVILNF